MKFIVTAGGQGTKVWPMSREDKPKQFQEIVGSESLFSYQIKTLLKAYSTEDIFISTKRKYVKFVVEQAPEIQLKNIIVEPDYKKNRGPGEGYAILKLTEISPNEPFMIVQSDCLREPYQKFLEFIVATEALVKKDRKFVSGGQKAITPDLGADYLMLREKIRTNNGIEVFKVEKFIPRIGDFEKTKKLIMNFHVSTHCNHNAWYPELMLDSYEKYRPDWFSALCEIRKTFGKKNETELTDKIYKSMEEGPTEEVTKHIFSDGYIILTPFRWRDVGTWDSIYEYFSSDCKSYKDGNIVDINTKSCLIKGPKEKLIATLGVENLIIVDTSDALLICSKNNSGDVKNILEEIKRLKKDQYL